MKALITMGCKTDHGGTVIEADHSFLVKGKAVHLEGMSHYCPTCRMTVSAISSGKGFLTVGNNTIIMAGDKATCGATFLPQQFFVVRSGGAYTNLSQFTNSTPFNDSFSEIFDEQVVAEFNFSEGMPYFIETENGKTLRGFIGSDGKLPRISTESSENYRIYIGEEAVIKGSDYDS